MDQRSHGPPDGWTDKVSYGAACLQLKIKSSFEDRLNVGPTEQRWLGNDFDSITQLLLTIGVHDMRIPILI